MASALLPTAPNFAATEEKIDQESEHWNESKGEDPCEGRGGVALFEDNCGDRCEKKDEKDALVEPKKILVAKV